MEGDFANTREVFQHVAETVQLHHLRELCLDRLECVGDDLRRFLLNHTSLARLWMQDLNLTGDTRLVDVLSTLRQQHESLAFVKLYQIADNSFRIAFRTLGDVNTSSEYLPSWRREASDFFADFLHVSKPARHCATIEEWEGVKDKLRRLSEDIIPTGRTYQSRHPIEWYGWIDKDDFALP